MQNIEEKYNKLTKNNRFKLSQILKRKRLELGYTLERIADGICSTSYLSKIENCLVEVDDTYYSLLFERLNLNYDDVLTERLVPVDIDILNCYLQNDLKSVQNYVNSSLNNTAVTSVENELFVLLYNVLNNNFKEAIIAIRRIELIYRTLTEEEKLFYQFIEALIHFKKGEYYLVYTKAKELLDKKIDDDVLKLAIMDLVLDFYFITNRIGSFFNLFTEFKNTQLSVKYRDISMKHQLQALVCRFEDPDVEMCFDFHLGSSGARLDDYNYYYAFYLLKKKEYQKAYDYLIETKITSKTALLLAMAIDKLNNNQYAYDFLNHHFIKNQKYDETVKNLIEYYIMKFQNFDHGYLLNYLRRTVTNPDFQIDGGLYYETFKCEYFNTAFELGRYKEVVKSFINK